MSLDMKSAIGQIRNIARFNHKWEAQREVVIRLCDEALDVTGPQTNALSWNDKIYFQAEYLPIALLSFAEWVSKANIMDEQISKVTIRFDSVKWNIVVSYFKNDKDISLRNAKKGK